MNVKKCFFVFIFTFLLFFNVDAMDYKEMELIPVDTSATVRTDSFDYVDFIYSSAINEKGNSTINFSSIYNKTSDSMYIAVEILLFDEEQKNVGFVTYCTEKDINSEYSRIKLDSGQSMAFKIDVVANKYFAKEKSPKDVKYIAVMGDNKYCHIGGYTKYADLTIEQIAAGQLNDKKTHYETIMEFYKFLNDNGIIIIAAVLITIIMIITIYGSILNSLNKRMYGKGTTLAYLPIVNLYIGFKLSFGKLIATILMLLYFVSIPLIIFKIGMVLTKVLSIIYVISLIIIIIKLITKRYDLFYYEPKGRRFSRVGDNSASYVVQGTDKTGFGISSARAQESNTIGTTNNNESSLIDSDDNNSDISAMFNNSHDIRDGKQKEEESDLSKFFN